MCLGKRRELKEESTSGYEMIVITWKRILSFLSLSLLRFHCASHSPCLRLTRILRLSHAVVLKTAPKREGVYAGIEFRFRCSIACTLPNLAARVSRRSLVIYCHPLRLLLPSVSVSHARDGSTGQRIPSGRNRE